MGALTPIASGIGSLGSLASTVLPLFNTANQLISTFQSFGSSGSSAEDNAGAQLRARQRLALKQLQQKQSLDIQSREGDAALDRTKLLADATAANASRRAALKRAVARQKAIFGSRGLGAESGSTEAILLGLFEESDDEKQDRNRLDTLRSQVIEQDLGQRKSLNVLQRTQLKARQKLERELLG